MAKGAARVLRKVSSSLRPCWRSLGSYDRCIFSAMDVNQSGEVDYTEFLAATLASSKQFETSLSGASLHTVFNELDTDHDGYIDSQDMQAFFEQDGDVESSIRQLATSTAQARSGKINYDGFKQSVLSMLKTAEDQGATLTKIHRKATPQRVNTTSTVTIAQEKI